MTGPSACAPYAGCAGQQGASPAAQEGLHTNNIVAADRWSDIDRADPAAGCVPGDATALQELGSGRMQAIAEPVRLGGGSALVVSPSR